MDSATADSSKANWSPTHFREPPPNGRNAKFEDTCNCKNPDTLDETGYGCVHRNHALLQNNPTFNMLQISESTDL
jgi:hypothetical protein